MALHTPIEWTDSAVNTVMGCDGCELWVPSKGVKKCYAGVLHQLRGGKVKGYAQKFDEPEMFPGRMAKAAAWSDLRGKDRPDKPWLNGLPRVIFVSDMGDALSRSIPLEYLREEVIANVVSPNGSRHIWMWLTKQPQRMAAFAQWLQERGIPWPCNLWAGTSITSPETMARLRHLKKVPAAVRFLSCEPLYADLGTLDLDGIALLIAGGESGPGSALCDLSWLRSLVAQARGANCVPFIKQVGARPTWGNGDAPGLGGRGRIACFKEPAGLCGTPKWCVEAGHCKSGARLGDDRKGGDMDTFPADLRVREFPHG